MSKTTKKNAKASRKESDSETNNTSEPVATPTAAAAKPEEKKSAPKMEYRLVGPTGLKVSVLSYGSYGWFEKDIDKVANLMKTAYDYGVNFFDCAEGYYSGECERVVGQVVRKLGWKRSDLVISTKLFFGDGSTGPNDSGLSRKHLIEGIQGSLKRLQMDYVDLLFCHRPDPLTPIEETVRAMDYIVNKGYAFYWGTSEWSAAQINEAIGIAKDLKLIGPVMEQPEYNMFHRERVEAEYAPLYKAHKLGTTIWSALGSGVLSGKYNDGIPKGSRFDDSLNRLPWVSRLKAGGAGMEAIFSKLKQIGEIAKELSCTTPALALAWCLKNPNVNTVISSASNPGQIDDAVTALAVLPKVTPEIMARIEKILDNKPAGEGFFGR
jgi:voltage-dependent potassium channel beta subunit